MNRFKTQLLALATLFFPFTASAQYTIYPIPHTQTAGKGSKVAFTKNVNIVCDDAIDTYTRQRAQTILAEHGFTATISTTESNTLSNIYLGVASGNGLTKAAATKLQLNLSVLTKSGKFDRHVLSLTNAHDGVAQLIIIGENTDATFMGLASLEQMLDAETKQMPTVTISDYADLKERGIIEGFYGKPYSSEVRKDLLRFMMRNKMNCYVYGPKSDVYHSGKWTEAYPTELTEAQRKSGFVTQQDLREFTDVAHQTKVSVVWAIHPGNDLLNDNGVVEKIMGKFAKMHTLGFRQFAVFADDVNRPENQNDMNLTASRIADIQRSIESRWNTNRTSPTDIVKPLRFTPQIYCRNYAASQWQFNQFFKALSIIPKDVTIYYTGGGVWSVPNNYDLNTVQYQFGRNVIWWWNYPCNDNGSGPSEIYPLDMRSNFFDMPNVDNNARLETELTASNQGILCNPMEQGSAARTAVFSAGDYSWNNRGFDNNASWEASFRALFPGRTELQNAYRFLAPYLSKNDPTALNTAIEAYKRDPKNDQLTALMTQIVDNCNVLTTMEHSKVTSDSLLYVDIRPWVLRLRAMAAATKGFIASQKADNIIEAWAYYLPSVKLANTLTSSPDYMTNHMSGFGSDGISTDQRLTHASWRYLTPFVTTYLSKHISNQLFPTTTNKNTVLTNAESTQLNLSQSDECISLKGSATLPEGGYAGIALAQPVQLKQITIASKLFADTDYKFMYSTDGKTWNEMETNNVTTDEYVHYMVVLNVSNKQKNLTLDAASVQLFVYNNTPEEVRSITPPAYNYWNNHTAQLMTDGDYTTYTCLNRDMVVGDTYTLELYEPTTIENVRICMGTTNGDYPKTALLSVSTDNHNWTDLTVKGTQTREYDMSLQQNFHVATEPEAGTDVMALDFVPTDHNFNPIKIEAKYVRLKITAIWGQPKWMRLHEIEINGLPAPVLTPMSDAEGNNVEAATDADATTFTSTNLPTTADGSKFVYRFLNVAKAKSLTLFCDDTTMQNATYSLTQNGNTWKPITPESKNGVVTFSFDANTKPVALQIAWTGNTTPAIYEAIEDADESTGKPVITDVHTIADNSNKAVVLTLENGALIARSDIGINTIHISTINGRNIFSQQLSGKREAYVPVFTTNTQAVVVNIKLTNGKSTTYKLINK